MPQATSGSFLIKEKNQVGLSTVEPKVIKKKANKYSNFLKQQLDTEPRKAIPLAICDYSSVFRSRPFQVELFGIIPIIT